MRWMRQRLTFANVVSVIALFVALGGGTAIALHGTNRVQSNDLGPGAQVKEADVADNAIVSGDIKDGEVSQADVADNAIASGEIKDGEVSVRDTDRVIPSGATITGAFRQLEDDNGGAAGTSSAALEFGVDFYGLRAPTALTDADVNFDDTGISADAAANSEESSGCTGGIGIPTAPPGKVCIYLFLGAVDNGSAFALSLGHNTGFNQADDKGFDIAATSNNGVARLGGSWAYTAP